MWYKIMLYLALTFLSVAIHAKDNHARLHPHIDYIQTAYLFVEDDSTEEGTIKGNAVNLELQKLISESIYARVGFQRYEDDDNSVELDDTYLGLGYVFYHHRNIAHALEIGATRSNINLLEFPLGTSITRYRAGYRVYWHINHKWDFDGHLYYFDESESDFILQEAYSAVDLKFNYYFGDSWGVGLQVEVGEYTNMAGLTLRYVF